MKGRLSPEAWRPQRRVDRHVQMVQGQAGVEYGFSLLLPDMKQGPFYLIIFEL